MKKRIFSAAALALVAVVAFSLVGQGIGTSSAQTGQTYDVAFSKMLLEMPGQGFFVRDDVPLNGVRWLSGGYFAIGGYCSGRTGSNKKGLWAFTEAGFASGARDQCLDLGESSNGSVAHTWAVSGNIQPVGPTSFVKEMSGSNDRPPAYYTISGGALNYVSKAYVSEVFSNSNSGSNYTNSVAAIPGYAVANRAQGSSLKTVLYSLPNWTVLQELPVSFIPLTGVGNYIVGTPSPGNSGLVAYKVVGNSLQSVGSVSTRIRPTGWAVDSKSPSNTAGFFFRNDSGRSHVSVYTVGENGFSLVRDVNLSNSSWTGSDAIGLSGEYIAFSDCSLSATPLPPSGTSDSFSAAKCGLGVMKGSAKLNTQRLPYATTVGASSSAAPVQVIPPVLNGFAISPNGTIVATSFYGAYMFKVGGVSGVPPGPTPSSTLPTLPGQTFNITYGTSSVASGSPSVLIRLANVTAVEGTNLKINIFGQAYTVDTSRSEVVGSNWAPTTLASFMSTKVANVWGTLDPQDPTIIRAMRVRNPAQVIPGLEAATAGTTPTPGAATTPTVGPANASAATQVQLNVLQEALRALQLRLGQ